MFVSFLMPHETRAIKARHLCMFYKQLGELDPKDIAFIGTPEYFRDPEVLRAEGRGEWQPLFQEIFGFTPPATLDGVLYHVLPDDLLAARLRRLRSPMKVYRALLTERLPEVERAFAAGLDALGAVRPIEAVLLFANVLSVEQVARERGIPVIHNEVGPLRGPVYIPTAYWDRRGVNGHTDALRRYRAFRREIGRRDIGVLTRPELLRTMRRIQPLEGPAVSDAPYLIGVALQVDDDSNLLAYARGFSGLDLTMAARNAVPKDRVLIRCHPQGLSSDNGHLGIIDRSPDVADFIQACQTVITVNSSTALEAMLFGRRVVVYGDSPFRIAADRALDGPSRRSEADRLLALNFLLFGYLMPYALIFDADYSRWRLGDPPELDIYRFHQRWYREQLQLDGHEGPVTFSTTAKLLPAWFAGRRDQGVMVFGAGEGAPALIDHLRANGVTLLGVFDSDERKWGSRIAGLSVSPPAYRDDVVVVVASLNYAEAMTARLRSLGYPADRIVTLLPGPVLPGSALPGLALPGSPGQAERYPHARAS
jgi:hypothetical protein